MSDETTAVELARLRARVERLESEVERLAGASPAPQPPAPAPPPTAAPTAAAPPLATAPPRAPGPRAPRRERNPVVVVAAAGAAIFLVGAVFLLRFAVEQGWIGPELRFLGGVLLGTGLASVAARHLLAGARGLGTALLAAGVGTLEFTLYVGAHRYGFYPSLHGLAVVALVCLVAGGLAARSRAAGAFLVAYLAAFLAPFVFATGDPRWIELSAFELALLAAAVAVAHLAPEARGWGWSRWTVVATQGLVQLGVAVGAARGDAPALLALLVVGLALAALWIWRARPGGAPATTPALLWVSTSLGALGVAALLWPKLPWPRESLALAVLALAALQLALVRPLRRGLAAPGGELGLFALAGALLLLAVPIALDWSRVGPIWALLALAAVSAAAFAERQGARAESAALDFVAAAAALSASARWAFASGAFDLAPAVPPLPFANEPFVTAALVAVAWLLISRRGWRSEALGFLALEAVANLALAFELAHLVGRLGGGEKARSVTLTLVWATSGAAQWLVGLTRRSPGFRRALVAAGYAGLAVAFAKLIFVDLAESHLALRALAFLVAGGIFLGAALAAHRLAPPTEKT